MLLPACCALQARTTLTMYSNSPSLKTRMSPTFSWERHSCFNLSRKNQLLIGAEFGTSLPSLCPNESLHPIKTCEYRLSGRQADIAGAHHMENSAMPNQHGRWSLCWLVSSIWRCHCWRLCPFWSCTVSRTSQDDSSDHLHHQRPTTSSLLSKSPLTNAVPPWLLSLSCFMLAGTQWGLKVPVTAGYTHARQETWNGTCKSKGAF